MGVATKSPPITLLPASETDLLMQSLIRSFDLARSMQMTMLERLVEMALIELGQTIATQEKSLRDQKTH